MHFFLCVPRAVSLRCWDLSLNPPNRACEDWHYSCMTSNPGTCDNLAWFVLLLHDSGCPTRGFIEGAMIAHYLLW